MDRVTAQDSAFFSERFLASRPLLEAVRSAEPVVLLIDEVDRERLEMLACDVAQRNGVAVDVHEHRGGWLVLDQC